MGFEDYEFFNICATANGPFISKFAFSHRAQANLDLQAKGIPQEAY